MVEITIDNFDQKFQEINYCLQKANFLGNKMIYCFVFVV